MARKTSQGGSLAGVRSKSDLALGGRALQPIAAIRRRYAEADKVPNPPAPVHTFKDMSAEEREALRWLYEKKP